MPRCWSSGLVFLVAAPVAAAAGDLEAASCDDDLQAAFAVEAEGCTTGDDQETCEALKLLQLRGTAVQQEGWITVTQCCQGHDNGFCSPNSGRWYTSKAQPYYKDCNHIHDEAGKGCIHNEERIAEVWQACNARSNAKCSSCSIWSAQHNPALHSNGGPGCAYVGEKVVPTQAIGGAEAITMATASQFNGVWNCAARRSQESRDEALIMNPWKARTQHQLHVIVKRLSSHGQNLASRLETVTGCQEGGWHDAHWGCSHSQARLYNTMPSVFSQVLTLAQTGVMGQLVFNPTKAGQSLATIGISVLYICGGKPVVLATSDGGHGSCSVEHQLT